MCAIGAMAVDEVLDTYCTTGTVNEVVFCDFLEQNLLSQLMINPLMGLTLEVLYCWITHLSTTLATLLNLFKVLVPLCTSFLPIHQI